MGKYEQPTYVTSDPDDAERLFIVEKAGRIKLTTAGRTSTFLDQMAITRSAEHERGLLSMAFAPDFAETRLFYVFYTSFPDGSLRVDELLADGDAADPDSRRNVLEIPHPNEMHNGGQLQFGPDGYLYISTGDGGGEGGFDPDRNGQDPTTLLGVLLRIDPRQSGADPYTVPAGNPYVGTENADEIWSWGLRNPWRFSFDRDTNALTIADVGQDRREEINYRPQDVGGGRGDNFGWNCREGFVTPRRWLSAGEWQHFEPPEECEGAGPFIDPVLDYPQFRELGEPLGACTIIGGYVVRDPSLADLDGRYLYTDLCKGELRSVALELPLAQDDCSEGLTVKAPSSFGEDAEGGIYVASLSGVVSRVVGESERRNCVEVRGPPTVKSKMPLSFALPGFGAIALITALVLACPRLVRRMVDWENLGPLDRELRTAGAPIAAAGAAAAGVAILAEQLGLGAEAARADFGWKRITLLAAGAAVATIGTLLLARPRIAYRVIDFEQVGPLERKVRIAATPIVATGLAAAAVAILAEDLGLSAEAARGIWGWERVSMLVAGAVVAAIAALVLARPRIASGRLTSRRPSDQA